MVQLDEFLPPSPDKLAEFGKTLVTDVLDTGIEIMKKPSEVVQKANDNLKRLRP